MSLKATFEGFVDFLFPKALGVLELETLSPGELVTRLSAPHSLGDVGPDTIAIFSYTDPRVRDLVWELKYRKNVKIASTLATIVYDVLCHELAERALFDNFIEPLLVPMPMSDKRRSERGWNQTEVLCEEIKKLDVENLFEYSPNILSKHSHTESQTKTVNKKLRLRNLENSMTVAGPEFVRGKNIILLDDVTTTGATFAEARRALRSADACKILCLAIAH
ncbi:hypothetical protein KW800_01700 [Candidatus Parcubacteria bacterium]|nr:hypothetical protein [Candidatus Parcubacteria bacterium]